MKRRTVTSDEYKALVKQRTKYGARKTIIDGITFASKREADRYGVLKMLLLAGEISELECQHPFDCIVNGVLVCRYLADFVYRENGHWVVEDTKGVKTAVYKLKKRLLKACLGIDIKES